MTSLAASTGSLSFRVTRLRYMNQEMGALWLMVQATVKVSMGVWMTAMSCSSASRRMVLAGGVSLHRTMQAAFISMAVICASNRLPQMTTSPGEIWVSMSSGLPEPSTIFPFTTAPSRLPVSRVPLRVARRLDRGVEALARVSLVASILDTARWLVVTRPCSRPSRSTTGRVLTCSSRIRTRALWTVSEPAAPFTERMSMSSTRDLTSSWSLGTSMPNRSSTYRVSWLISPARAGL